ncbi:hypothetical protein Scep_001267 [Stephania cephalantha]|uniref:Uncharacterized protein n=1 Tax=Stephania cephalantha TaxID=152367 RepID=A0AAP0Q7J6_9MAGN
MENMHSLYEAKIESMKEDYERKSIAMKMDYDEKLNCMTKAYEERLNDVTNEHERRLNSVTRDMDEFLAVWNSFKAIFTGGFWVIFLQHLKTMSFSLMTSCRKVLNMRFLVWW